MKQTPPRSIAHAACAAELLAVALLGVMAGFFFAFSVDVAPAMARLDASHYVTTQQWINRVVRNATFGSVYFGATLCPFVAATWVWLSGRRKAALIWALIATVYFATVFWLTRSINVPINDVLALWDPAAPPAAWRQARDDWNTANDYRCIGSLLCFVSALVVTTWSRQAGPHRPIGSPG